MRVWMIVVALSSSGALAQVPDMTQETDPDLTGAVRMPNFETRDDPPPPQVDVPIQPEPTGEPAHGEITGDANRQLQERFFGSSGSSHTESSSSSSSSSVTFGSDNDDGRRESPDTPGGPWAIGNPAGADAAAVAGNWTLQLSGVSCGMSLGRDQFIDGVYSAYPSNTCAAGVSKVGNWRPTPNGNGIRLIDRMRQTVGELWSYGPNRWEGRIGGEKAVLTR